MSVDAAVLRELLRRATPGPWGDDYGRGVIAGYVAGGTVVLGMTVEPADADLIIAAVNALPGLLDAAATANQPAPPERDATHD